MYCDSSIVSVVWNQSIMGDLDCFYDLNGINATAVNMVNSKHDKHGNF